MKKIILSTPGAHGNFLRFLFDCYDKGHVMEYNLNNNGNWHNMSNTQSNNLYFDMANDHNRKNYSNLAERHEKFHIVFDTVEEFYYLVQCFIDRGGYLKEDSGIRLLEKDIGQYEKKYKVPVTYKKNFKDLYNFEGDTPPRSLLRNFFILNFITHFDHNIWKVNNELKNSNGCEMIHLRTILDYTLLKTRLDNIFQKSLDFQELHAGLLANNYPYSQRLHVLEVIKAVENNKDIEIKELNSISEAYICFYFEKKHYDINFNLSESFYKSTRELIDYIRYFPNYMKKPNNLFRQHWKIYNV